MISVILIESFDDLSSYTDELSLFIKKQEVRSSLYHQPEYIESVLKKQSNITSWRLVIFKEEGRIVAFIPLYVLKDNFPVKIGILTLLSFKLRILKFFGHGIAYDNNFSETFLYNALEDLLSNYSNNYDVGFLESVPSESKLLGHFSKGCKRICVKPVSTKPDVVRLLNISGTWSDYLKAMKRKRRYNLNKYVKKMESKASGDLRLHRYVEEKDVGSFFSIMDEIYQQTWQASAFGYVNRKSDLEAVKNLTLAKLGNFNSFILFCKDEPVAFLRGYLHKGKFYYEEIGYKQHWHNFNPGSVLNMLALSILFDDKNVEILDFGYGENTYKKIFGNFSFAAINVMIVKKLSFCSFLVIVQQLLQSIYECIHWVLVMIGLDGKVRSLLKKKPIKI